MTPEQITVPKQTWDAMLEALEILVKEATITWDVPESFPQVVVARAALTAAKAVQQPAWRTGGGGIPRFKPQAQPVALQWVAEMIMSDCGCSTNNERLLERVVGRIEQYERANAPSHPQASEPAEKRKLYECTGCGHLFDEKPSSCDCGENPGNTYNDWIATPAAPEAK